MVTGHAMIRNIFGWALAVVLVCMQVLYPANATEEPPKGLMWNRTGLPLVFPLQIKTRPGADYYLVLENADTGQDALAAYFQGGEFFRVLVPPATYQLRFSYGHNWRNEEQLLGPKTRHFVSPKPLTFKTRGYGTKEGWIVDLTPHTVFPEKEARLRRVAVCQTFALVDDPLHNVFEIPKGPDQTGICANQVDGECAIFDPALRLDVQSRVCF